MAKESLKISKIFADFAKDNMNFKHQHVSNVKERQ
jgi:hypothetical protein